MHAYFLLVVLHAILTVSEASSLTKSNDWSSRERNAISTKHKQNGESNRSYYGATVTVEITAKGKLDYQVIYTLTIIFYLFSY